MANSLSGSLSGVSGVSLHTEAATQYTAMCTAAGKTFPIIFGYVSPFDWMREALAMLVIPTNPETGTPNPAIQKLVETGKQVIEKADFSADDLATLEAAAKYFDDNVPYGNWDFTKLPNNPANHWGQRLWYKAREWHPFIGKDSAIYGWPAKFAYDPRRTGKLIVLQLTGEEITWMFQNAHKYGFIWYGPTLNTFLYVGEGNVLPTFNETYQKIAAFGLDANLWPIFKKAFNGKEATTPTELKDFATKVINGEIPETTVATWGPDMKGGKEGGSFNGYDNWQVVLHKQEG